jgi:hypothetical protein
MSHFGSPLRGLRELLAALPELAGKTFGCWCAPRPCHGEVLARLAGELELPARKGILRILGKGQKIREIPVVSGCAPDLGAYEAHTCDNRCTLTGGR